jgi:hypothetical protein
MLTKKRDFSSHDIRQGIAKNSELPCVIKDCSRPRTKLATLCLTHLRRRYRWGDEVHGRRFKPRELAAWNGVAERFVNANARHPGIEAAVKWFDERLQRAYLHVQGASTSAALARHLRQLEDLGVTGEQCLVRALAVWLYASSLPEHQVPEAVVTSNLGAHVLADAKLEKGDRVRTGIRRLLGQQIRDALGVLLIRVAHHQKEELQRESEMKALFAEPFAPSLR